MCNIYAILKTHYVVMCTSIIEHKPSFKIESQITLIEDFNGHA